MWLVIRCQYLRKTLENAFQLTRRSGDLTGSTRLLWNLKFLVGKDAVPS